MDDRTTGGGRFGWLRVIVSGWVAGGPSLVCSESSAQPTESWDRQTTRNGRGCCCPQPVGSRGSVASDPYGSRMDTDYLLTKIDEFIELAETARGRPDDISVLADQLNIIAAKIRPDLASFGPSPAGRNQPESWKFAQRRARILREFILVRGRLSAALKDEEQGPVGPSIEARSLHPWVWNAAAAHWDQGHHQVAVREAARALLVHLREYVGSPDWDGQALINLLFSDDPASPDTPRLRTWRPAGATEDTQTNLHRGTASLGRACVALIRNVELHGETGNDERTALEMLATLSLFARRVTDGCRVDVGEDLPE